MLYLKVSRDDGDGTEDKPIFVTADDELIKAVGTLIEPDHEIIPVYLQSPDIGRV